MTPRKVIALWAVALGMTIAVLVIGPHLLTERAQMAIDTELSSLGGRAVYREMHLSLSHGVVIHFDLVGVPELSKGVWWALPDGKVILEM